MLVIAAMAGLLASMAMAVIRGIVGPTTFDRILAVNMFGTNIVVFIAFLGHVMGTEFFLDISMIYALTNFVTTVAFLRYFKYRKENVDVS